MGDAAGESIGTDSTGKPAEAKGDHPYFGIFKACAIGDRNEAAGAKRKKPLFEESFGRTHPNRQRARLDLALKTGEGRHCLPYGKVKGFGKN